ncbi:hypothetical protein PL81_41145 [Streptomyces sp. RSD-27]|nr:hypothetical protein PL81_41145 [Streptomyces sp. RSD-27]
MATSWVTGSTPLTENQGGDLVGLQHMGSEQGEEYAWRQVGAWNRKLSDVLAADDGSGDSRHRVAATPPVRADAGNGPDAGNIDVQARSLPLAGIGLHRLHAG